VYKHLLETWGFELVMQFNEQHQQRRRKTPAVGKENNNENEVENEKSKENGENNVENINEDHQQQENIKNSYSRKQLIKMNRVYTL